MKISSANTISAIACAVAFNLVSSLAIAAQEESRFIFQYKDGQSSVVHKALNRAGARIARELPSHNAVAAHVSTTALQRLSRNPNIQSIDEDVKRYPLATQFEPDGIPYGIPMVQADQVTENTDDPQKTVCIIDSGIDITHPEFETQFNISGTNDPGTGDWFTDEVDHGTHVAGTVAALKNGDGVIGVNSSGVLNIHIIKVFGADGWAYSSDLIAALDACQVADADVVSMSLGGSRPNRKEDEAFAAAAADGVLSIAAAGNDGNTAYSYPASYDSVVSVAAIDANMAIADFSQQNDQVELSAPGVMVVSSVPVGTGLLADVAVDFTDYEAFAMDGSPMLTASGELVNCGLALDVCDGVAGAVCLIQRGDITFAEKVLNCENGGGVAAIIYNNVPDAFLGTLEDTVTTIPSVSVSDTDGASMIPGSDAVVAVYMGDYGYKDGTSMATPHVSGVAALIWNNAPVECSAADVRNAMTQSALDLGDIDRDDAYGFGLVQAADAQSLLLDEDFCGNLPICGLPGDACITNADCCSEACKGKPGDKVCR